MGLTERRARQKEQLRREILDAAGELFAQEGYNSVSMRKIADRIEYSPTTIYLYFSDKAELLHTLCEDVFARLIERIDTETEKASDPLDGLVRGCRAYIRFGLEHPDLYIVTFVQPSDGRPCDSEKTFEGSVAQECFNCLGGAIQACVESGQIPPVDVKKAACLCWAACHGLTSLLITHERFPWAEKDELIEGMLTSMIRGLEAGTIEALPASAANQG